MRINVYSQELTPEVICVEKKSNTGIAYHAAQLVLHSSPMLHHSPTDDDRSAVTFWLPKSAYRCEEMAQAFERIAGIFRGAANPCDPLHGKPFSRTPIPDCPQSGQDYAEKVDAADVGMSPMTPEQVRDDLHRLGYHGYADAIDAGLRRQAGEAVAESMADHVAGETGYCRFLQSVPFMAKLYTRPAESTGVPDGWRLVPIAPTYAMIEAAMRREDDEPCSGWGKIVSAPHAAIYAAMLAAAPSGDKP